MEPEGNAFESEHGTLAPDAPETPAADAPSFEEEILGDNPPPFIQALEAEAPEGGSFKGVPRPDTSNLPPEVAKTYFNLRHLAQSKSNEAATARREAAEAKAAVEQERAALVAEREQMLGIFKNPKLLELLQAPAAAEAPDQFKDPAGFAAFHAKTAAAQVVGEMLTRLGAVSEEAKQAAQAALAEQARNVRRGEISAFVSAHPDFEQHADAIEVLVQRHNFKVEDAYEIATARAARVAAAPRQAVDPRAAMRVPGAASGLPATPKGMDVHQLQDWYDANPGTRERDAAEYSRRMGW